MEAIVKILDITEVTHDVRRYRVEKPAGYSFNPGQATDVSINLPRWKEEKRPFTFTALNDAPYLEFTIKSYRDHDGVTNQLGKLAPGGELIVRDVWGAIEYKGPGYFIAGGAGITPFLAILRQLHKEGRLAGNTLFFSNKTSADIILREELTGMLGENAFYLVTQEKTGAPSGQADVRGKTTGVVSGYLDKAFLQAHIKDFSQRFYLCGPDKMVAALQGILGSLGASSDSVVFEK
jgi:ferredoxin-NADP reductase